jgi:hypothetical protein
VILIEKHRQALHHADCGVMPFNPAFQNTFVALTTASTIRLT